MSFVIRRKGAGTDPHPGDDTEESRNMTLASPKRLTGELTVKLRSTRRGVTTDHVRGWSVS